MNTRQVEEVLRNISYKPGWRLAWNYIRLDGEVLNATFLSVRWVFTRPDSFDQDTIEEGDSGPAIIDPTQTTEEGLVRRIFQLALSCEEHECREFFRYGDQTPFWPHIPLIKPLLEEEK